MNTLFKERTAAPAALPIARQAKTRPRFPLGLSPTTLGGIFCLISVVCYAIANSCMRHLSYVGCDDSWAICNRELVSFLTAGVWLLVHALVGRPRWPALRLTAILLTAGLASQLIGNTGMQWAYGVAGLGFMVSSNSGFVLIFGALLGYFLLGERMGSRHILSMAMIIAAIGLLWLGAQTVCAQTVGAQSGGGASLAGQSGARLIAVSVAVAAIAGVCYTVQNIAIRYSVTRGTPIEAVVFVITGSGALTLGPMCLMKNAATSPLAHTPLNCYPWMYAAGICNMLGFLALIGGLKHTTVTHVNIIAAIGIALAALLGIVFYGEHGSLLLLAGVGMTVLGVLAFGGPTADASGVDELSPTVESLMP